MNTVLIAVWAAAACCSVQDGSDPALSAGETSRLLQDAELRMAMYRKLHPPVHKLVVDVETGLRMPYVEMVADPDSPLLDAYCTFKVDFEDFEYIPSPSQVDYHDPREPPERIVVLGAIGTFLRDAFTLVDIYRDDANRLYAAAARVERLEREIEEAEEEQERAAEEAARVAARSELPAGQPVAIHTAKCVPVKRTYKPRRIIGGNRVRMRRAVAPGVVRRKRGGFSPFPYPGSGGGSRSNGDDCRSARRRRDAVVADKVPDDRAMRRNADEEYYRRREIRARREREETVRGSREIENSFAQELADARHQIRIVMPDDFVLPAKMPRRFRAVVLVTQVAWDRAADLPTLVIDADLVRCTKLGAGQPIAVSRKPADSRKP